MTTSPPSTVPARFRAKKQQIRWVRTAARVHMDIGLCAAYKSEPAHALHPRRTRSEHPFELPGGIRGVMLKLESGGRLELFEHPESSGGLRAGSPLEALATRGYGHVALGAADIGPLFERAVQAGATPRVAPGPSPEPGVRFAFLTDPEGNLVELVER